MIANLKPYLDYKDSGSSWLGQVPIHWEVCKLRNLISPMTERNGVNLPLLSVARERGVFVRSLTDGKENHNVIPEDLSNFKVARAGNLVINKMKAWQGSMGIAPCDGIVSPAYFVFEFAIFNHEFGQVLLRSKTYVAHFYRASDGVRVGQWDLTIPAMRQIPVIVPPPLEQEAIVRFLGWANGRLERAIRAKRKMITLLNEQKQAIIHRAVTRGLDPSVPLKPSGIPWLGDIPAHWEVRRIKSFLTNVNVQTTMMNVDEVYIALENVESWTGRVNPQRKQGGNNFFGQVKKFKPDDILFGKLRPYLAKVTTASVSGVCVGEFFVLRSNVSLIAPRFLEQFLRTPTVINVINSSTFGAKMPRADWQFFGNLAGALPPIEEQLVIVKCIELTTRPLINTIVRLEREIALLREYHTRLTADVVTGKLDVRAAARQLPKELDPEPLPVENEDPPVEDGIEE